MKKIIRLTESDLHNMIEEAVKLALNELDPRTYASAMNRAKEKNDPRAGKFGQAAADAWNKDYSTSETETFKNGVTSKRNEKLAHDNKLYSGGFAYDTDIKTVKPNGDEEQYLKSYDVYPTLTNKTGANMTKAMRSTTHPKYVRDNYKKGKGWQ